MLKAVVLTFFFVASIDCGVERRSNISSDVLKEMIMILEKMIEQMNITDCKHPMPLVEEIKSINPAKVLCKASKAIQSFTPCPAMEGNVKKLKVILQNATGMKSKCTVGISQINLKDFLKKLEEFSRNHFNKFSETLPGQ